MTATSTSNMHCAHCGRPVITALWVGDLPYHPECTRGPGYQPRTFVEGCQAYTNLTEADIRRIVREELDRMNVVKDKSHD